MQARAIRWRIRGPQIRVVWDSPSWCSTISFFPSQSQYVTHIQVYFPLINIQWLGSPQAPINKLRDAHYLMDPIIHMQHTIWWPLSICIIVFLGYNLHTTHYLVAAFYRLLSNSIFIYAAPICGQKLICWCPLFLGYTLYAVYFMLHIFFRN